jgi:hypothetical protein
MPKPPFNAKYAGTCEVCEAEVRVGDEVQWGRARGAVVHVGCVQRASSNTPATNGRVSDASTALEKTAFRLFERLCENAGTADWDAQVLVRRAFTLADAFLTERAKRRATATADLPFDEGGDNA